MGSTDSATPGGTAFGSVNRVALATIREARGISQDELAIAVGISQPYYSRIETSARTRPSEQIIRDIAANLRCSPLAITNPRPECPNCATTPRAA